METKPDFKIGTRYLVKLKSGDSEHISEYKVKEVSKKCVKIKIINSGCVMWIAKESFKKEYTIVDTL